MNATRYTFSLAHGPLLTVRATLGDLPFYRGRAGEPAALTGPANHLLVPGENVLTLAIEAPSVAAAAALLSAPPHLSFVLRVDDDADTLVHSVSAAELWAELPPEQRKAPWKHVSRFHADTRLVRPACAESPRARFNRDGTPEQKEAVREIYRAFESGDAQLFLRAIKLELEERQRAYPGVAELSAPRRREKIAARFAKKWRIRPVDLRSLKELSFESRLEGRVAFVTRRDGGAAIEAVAAGDASNRVEMDLLLMRKGSAWRVFR
ncbi:MAG: hypothetical protein ABJE95_05110 [Byssovorax sp.]